MIWWLVPGALILVFVGWVFLSTPREFEHLRRWERVTRVTRTWERKH